MASPQMLLSLSDWAQDPASGPAEEESGAFQRSFLNQSAKITLVPPTDSSFPSSAASLTLGTP